MHAGVIHDKQVHMQHTSAEQGWCNAGVQRSPPFVLEDPDQGISGAEICRQSSCHSILHCLCMARISCDSSR